MARRTSVEAGSRSVSLRPPYHKAYELVRVVTVGIPFRIVNANGPMILTINRASSGERLDHCKRLYPCVECGVLHTIWCNLRILTYLPSRSSVFYLYLNEIRL